MLQEVPLSAAEPIGVGPSKSVTMLLASAVPVKVGVVLLVMLSEFDDPVSLAGDKSRAGGAPGAGGSVVMEKEDKAVPDFPAASVRLAWRALGSPPETSGSMVYP